MSFAVIPRISVQNQVNSLLEVPSLEAWYSTKDPVDLTVGGGTVQLWRDKSGKSAETVLACDGTGGATGTLGSTPSGNQSFSFVINVPFADTATAYGIVSFGGSYPVANSIVWFIDSAGVLELDEFGSTTSLYRSAKIAGFRSTYSNQQVAITATIISSTLVIYINGTNTAYTAGASATPPNWGDTLGNAGFFIGKLSTAANLYAGTFQRPAIYNRGLLQSEVTTLVAAQGVPTAADTNAAGATITAGAFVVGKKYRILVPGTTDFTLIGAADSNIGTEFTATGVGTGNGTATALGLLAYWDFSTATRGAATVTDTSGNSCVLTTSTGARISGARDLYQGTAASQPAYDGTAQTVTGDGVNDRMQSPPFALVQPVTQFDVFSMVSWTDTDVISDGFTAASGAIEQSTTTPQININAGSSVAANTNLAVAVNGVVVAEFNGATSTLVVNYKAATTGNAGAGNMNGITLFGAGGTAAKWANVAYKEHARFSRILSTAEKLRVINFLVRRCTITP